MAVKDMVLIMSQISFGAIATFMAILFWSHTRDTAWMLIIIAVIIQYGEIMYSTFKMFGVLGDDLFIIKDAPYMTGSILRLDGGYVLAGEKIPPMPKGIV